MGGNGRFNRVEDAEMLQDIRDCDEALQSLQSIADGEEVIPAHVPYAIILDGENPVKVWREYRDMTQQELAQAAGISASYLSQIETGKREGTTAVLQAIARAMNLTLDDVVV
jgi:DNA-binding XRE family transcriptional regulator